MKFNMDCARDILITVENQDLGNTLNFDSLCLILQNYTEDEIYYACIKLNEADYLEVKVINLCGQEISPIHHIGDLTFYGHEFLSNIRSDNNWNKTKEIATKVGSFSISALSQIATGVITQLINSQF